MKLSYIFTPDASLIRLGQWLLHWKRTRPLFSERYGYQRYWSIPFTNYRIRFERTKAMVAK